MNWQPEETAPRDGTTVLVCWFQNRRDGWAYAFAKWSDWGQFWHSHAVKVQADFWAPLTPPEPETP